MISYDYASTVYGTKTWMSDKDLNPSTGHKLFNVCERDMWSDKMDSKSSKGLYEGCDTGACADGVKCGLVE